jgi:hypothetical protein
MLCMFYAIYIALSYIPVIFYILYYIMYKNRNLAAEIEYFRKKKPVAHMCDALRVICIPVAHVSSALRVCILPVAHIPGALRVICISVAHQTHALWVSILPIAHHTCATGIFLPVACYPQRTAYALRVAILGALRVSFFLVV